jgi:hypothetical protein
MFALGFIDHFGPLNVEPRLTYSPVVSFFGSNLPPFMVNRGEFGFIILVSGL